MVLYNQGNKKTGYTPAASPKDSLVGTRGATKSSPLSEWHVLVPPPPSRSDPTPVRQDSSQSHTLSNTLSNRLSTPVGPLSISATCEVLPDVSGRGRGASSPLGRARNCLVRSRARTLPFAIAITRFGSASPRLPAFRSWMSISFKKTSTNAAESRAIEETYRL